MQTLLTILLGVFALNTANTTIAFDAEKGKEFKMLYYGAKVENVQSIKESGFAAQRAYPAYGMIGHEECSLSIEQADGNLTLDLRVEDATTTPWEGGEILCVTTKEVYYPIVVKNYYKTYRDLDLIETWVEITNTGKKNVLLTRFDSGHIAFRNGNTWICTQEGTWGAEAQLITEPLTRGMKVVHGLDNERNSQLARAEAMISLDGKPAENSGRVIGAALCYGGCFELRFGSINSDYGHFYAGILPDRSAYHLEKNETFTTPILAYSFSDKGLSGVSRNFHKWGRKYRLAHGDRERKILLNSWEGVYFDINEQGMAQMMGDIASMGGELFVMDDGWFGEKYPRKNDHTSLGDWKVDKAKLPNGVSWLVNTAAEKGVEFGIWIEPEMVNATSELYEAHPDWVFQSENHDLQYGRGKSQLCLDLTNPAVQDYEFSIIDNIMKENPGIKYIKWDCNNSGLVRGSKNVKYPSHLYIEYWRAFEKLCNRVRAAYPDITIQNCASGGGRVNWGILPWFDEFWTSDNTDALQRVYLQWSTSYFFPAIAMAAHISASPNHTIGHISSLKYRIDVAMSGRLGMELQPKHMTDSEKDFCRKAIADYKRIRPIVQFGEIYRLVSPYDQKGFASLMYTTEDKSKAVFYWFRTVNMHDLRVPRVQMAGLDPAKNYKVTELNRVDNKALKYEGKVFSGKFLMDNGLDIPIKHSADRDVVLDCSSRVLLLEEAR